MSNQKRNGPRPRPVSERFWDKVEVRGPDDCWPWVASLDGRGYGQVWNGTSNSRAHRVAYELLVGPLHDWLEIDHLCENKACVNPAHLEQVSGAVNTLRSSVEVRKTHCPQGHPYDEQNTQVRRGKRVCRACNAAGSRRWRAAKKRAA